MTPENSLPQLIAAMKRARSLILVSSSSFLVCNSSFGQWHRGMRLIRVSLTHRQHNVDHDTFRISDRQPNSSRNRPVHVSCVSKRCRLIIYIVLVRRRRRSTFNPVNSMFYRGRDSSKRQQASRKFESMVCHSFRFQ